MKNVEILAPAKNYETAIAAINSGADAIYIGADYFGARVNASNSLEVIENIVNYAHKYYVRVHVTINTILNNSELERAKKLIFDLYEIGVDAIIVQDFAILELAAKDQLPPIQIHMSTQCDNRSLEKVKFFDNIGVSRVILARELSINEIEKICKDTNCEIETFVHGALCVSYSGQCYLSYANGGRSANRGECAQPCRKRYSLVDEKGNIILKDKYLLSLKDFNASDNIEKLVDAGVNSFKIEGRLKDINYVKNVVLHYNNLISNYANKVSSGKVFTDFEPNIYKTFNRGYTDYFLNSRNNCYNFLSPKFIGEKLGKVRKISKDSFEIDAVLHPQDGLCFFDSDGCMSGCLVNKVIGNVVYPNKMLGIKVGTEIYRNYDSEFYHRLENVKIERKISVNIMVKPFEVIAIDEDNNKTTLKLPSGATPKNFEKLVNTYIKQLKKTGDSDFYVASISIESDNLPFLPISEINELRRKLLNSLMEVRLNNYKRITQKPIKYATFPIEKMDYRANVYNDLAKEFYKNCSCSVAENALESCPKIRSGIELMRTKHCLKYAANLCKKDVGSLFLLDENNKKYSLKFDCKNCEMVVLSP